jgi:hypothetical protein
MKAQGLKVSDLRLGRNSACLEIRVLLDEPGLVVDSEVRSLMNYWLSVFNEQTWGQFLEMSPKVYAFAEPRDRRLPNIQVGDQLLCYVSRKMVWAGVLNVIGDRYRDNTRLFSGGDYPIRYHVDPEILLCGEETLPMSELEGRLSFFAAGGTGKNWAPYLQKSPRKLHTPDANAIVEALVGKARTRTAS